MQYKKIIDAEIPRSFFAPKPYGNAFYSGQSGTFSVIDYEPVFTWEGMGEDRGLETPV